MRRLKEFAAAEGGVAAIEFGIIAAPFLALLVGALQLFIIFQAQGVLETGAESMGRQVLTGNAYSLSQSQFKALACRFIVGVIDCNNVMVDVQVAPTFAAANTSQPTLTYDGGGNVNNNWQYNPGTKGSIVVLRLIYQMPLVTAPLFDLSNLSNGSRLLMATSVFKNESQ